MGYVNHRLFFKDVYPESVAQLFAYNLPKKKLAMNPWQKIGPRSNILVQNLLHRRSTCVGMPQTGCFKRKCKHSVQTRFAQKKHHFVPFYPFFPSAIYRCRAIQPERSLLYNDTSTLRSTKVRLPRSSSSTSCLMRLCPKNIQPERNPSKQQES